jgi:hypothetical protein
VHHELLEMGLGSIFCLDLALKCGEFWIESFVKVPCLSKEISAKYENSNETMKLVRVNL